MEHVRAEDTARPGGYMQCEGSPGRPLAFLSDPGQAINFHRNIWHGVLTPLEDPGLFVVVDRIGSGENLEEIFFDIPYIVVPQGS